jgi:DNA-binding transcriptional LysR family regulator
MLTDYPTVRINIREGTSRVIRDLLLSGEMDVAVVSTLEDLTPFDSEIVLSESLFLVGRSGTLPAHATHAALNFLSGLPLVLTASPNSLRLVLDRALLRKNLRPSVIAEVESFEMALELMMQIRGFSVFPYCALHNALAAGLVGAVPIRGLSISWAVIVPRNRYVTAATSILRSVIRDCVCSLVNSGDWKTAKFLCQ